jgi:hypothetical protein
MRSKFKMTISGLIADGIRRNQAVITPAHSSCDVTEPCEPVRNSESLTI